MNKTKLKKIELEDITKYKIPSNPLFSPDGKNVAFQVTRSDVDKNEYHTDIWLYTIGDDKARQVTWTLDAGIVIWADNENIILSRHTKDDKAGATKLYKLNISGGEARPWLTLPFPVNTFKKVNDKLFAALGNIKASDPDAYKDSEETRKKKEEQEKEDKDYQIVDEIPYWFNGAGFTNGSRTALFTVEIIEDDGASEAKAACKRVTQPYFNANDLYVKDEKIYYCGNIEKSKQSKYQNVYAYDIKTKKTESIYKKNDLSLGGLFSLDGKLYVYASDMKKYGTNQTSDICLVEKDKITAAYVPEVSLYSSVLGDTAEGFGGIYEGEKEYLSVATVRDHNAIFKFTADKSGKKLSKKTIWEEDGLVCSMDASKDDIAIIYQGWDHVAEFFVMDKKTMAKKRVTFLNDEVTEGRYIAKPNRIDYTSEGLDLRGWVLLPDGFDPKKKYPAVLDVHGGPRCVYGETFFHEMQLWVAKGYVVFFTNIKGSDGRGDEFADIRNDYGKTDFKNLMDFTDAVLEAYPNIDKTKLCETGGSYGGFMTNWIIGHTDRFCCAASQRSISNWISFSFISDIGEIFGPDQCGAANAFGDENTRILWDQSPLKYADKVKTPTLFLHSDEDYRCPLPEGMQMMQAIAARGVETRMCIFRGENHELSRAGKPKHRMKRLTEITNWFDKHTK